MSEDDEILDLVNADDEVVGTVRRGDMVKLHYRHPHGYVRFAVAFLMNSRGQLWTPTRGMHKVISPGGLDFSVAEHVLSGETYGEAIERAFAEEAGIKIRVASLQQLGTLPPTPEKPAFDAVFLSHHDSTSDPHYSREEFIGGAWMTAEQIRQKIASGVPAKKTIVPALALL